MTAPPPENVPPARPHELRPRRWWYAVAACIAALGLLAGGLLGWQAYAAFPSVEAEVASGDTETVQLDEDGMTIYTDRQFREGGCAVTNAEGSEIAVEQARRTETLTVNDTQWQVVQRTAEPVSEGEYLVECRSDGAAAFGVGPHASMLGAVGLIIGAIGAAGLGVLIAGVVVLVVFLRRRGQRKRLEAQNFYGGGYPTGYSGGDQPQRPHGDPPE